jgi:hypothetical protein
MLTQRHTCRQPSARAETSDTNKNPDQPLGDSVAQASDRMVNVMQNVTRQERREDILKFNGRKVKEENCLISGVRAWKLLYKHYREFLAYLLNEPSAPGKLEEVPVVNKYPDVRERCHCQEQVSLAKDG